MLDKHTPLALETAAPVSPFDDPECLFVPLPDSMQTFTAPALHDLGATPETKGLLARLGELLQARRNGLAAGTIDLTAYAADTVQWVGQVLGQGEISALADAAAGRLVINEAVFTGVWRVRHYQDGQLRRDYLEADAYPQQLAEWVAAHDAPSAFPPSFPPTLMNAPALVHELFAKSKAFTVGAEEVVNLTLLPMTPDDLAFLTECLGLAGVSILSKGYGECRMRLTRLPNVWWVQHLNSTEQLVLNTLEITALPTLLMAAPEDLADSANRLAELLAGLD